MMRRGLDVLKLKGKVAVARLRSRLGGSRPAADPGAPARTDGEENLAEVRDRAREIATRQEDREEDVVGSAAADERLWAALRELAWPGWIVPAELGGSGRGLRAMAVGFEELAAAGRIGTFPVLTALATRAVAEGATAELRAALLPGLIGARRKVAFAATEEKAGFNMLELETAAERRGGGWVLTGSKVYTSGFDRADHLLVVARTLPYARVADEGLPRAAGISLFLLDLPADGLAAEPMTTRGEPGARQFALRFDGVEVSPDRLVGTEHEGAMLLFGCLAIERVLFCAMALGACRFMLRTAVEHAGGRRVFGDTPVGAYQAVQHPLADARIRLEAVAGMLASSADAFDAGAPSREVVGRANMAKYLTSELAGRTLDATLGAMGGRGFDERHGVIQLIETVKLMSLSPLSDHLILNEVAERVLGLPRSY